MDNNKGDDTGLTSTMGKVLSMSSKDEKNDTNDSTPTSSTDASTSTATSHIVSDDPISSTSSEIDQNIKSKHISTLSTKSEDVTDRASSVDPDADLLEIMSHSTGEKITENVEDLVQDLETLLGESTDSFNLPFKRTESTNVDKIQKLEESKSEETDKNKESPLNQLRVEKENPIGNFSDLPIADEVSGNTVIGQEAEKDTQTDEASVVMNTDVVDLNREVIHVQKEEEQSNDNLEVVKNENSEGSRELELNEESDISNTSEKPLENKNHAHVEKSEAPKEASEEENRLNQTDLIKDSVDKENTLTNDSGESEKSDVQEDILRQEGASLSKDNESGVLAEQIRVTDIEKSEEISNIEMDNKNKPINNSPAEQEEIQDENDTIECTKSKRSVQEEKEAIKNQNAEDGNCESKVFEPKKDTQNNVTEEEVRLELENDFGNEVKNIAESSRVISEQCTSDEKEDTDENIQGNVTRTSTNVDEIEDSGKIIPETPNEETVEVQEKSVDDKETVAKPLNEIQIAEEEKIDIKDQTDITGQTAGGNEENMNVDRQNEAPAYVLSKEDSAPLKSQVILNKNLEDNVTADNSSVKELDKIKSPQENLVFEEEISTLDVTCEKEKSEGKNDNKVTNIVNASEYMAAEVSNTKQDEVSNIKQDEVSNTKQDEETNDPLQNELILEENIDDNNMQNTIEELSIKISKTTADDRGVIEQEETNESLSEENTEDSNEQIPTDKSIEIGEISGKVSEIKGKENTNELVENKPLQEDTEDNNVEKSEHIVNMGESSLDNVGEIKETVQLFNSEESKVSQNKSIQETSDGMDVQEELPQVSSNQIKEIQESQQDLVVSPETSQDTANTDNLIEKLEEPAQVETLANESLSGELKKERKIVKHHQNQTTEDEKIISPEVTEVSDQKILEKTIDETETASVPESLQQTEKESAKKEIILTPEKEDNSQECIKGKISIQEALEISESVRQPQESDEEIRDDLQIQGIIEEAVISGSVIPVESPNIEKSFKQDKVEETISISSEKEVDVDPDSIKLSSDSFNVQTLGNIVYQISQDKVEETFSIPKEEIMKKEYINETNMQEEESEQPIVPSDTILNEGTKETETGVTIAPEIFLNNDKSMPPVEDILAHQCNEVTDAAQIDTEENLETILAVASLQNDTISEVGEQQLSEKEIREMEALRRAVESITENTDVYQESVDIAVEELIQSTSQSSEKVNFEKQNVPDTSEPYTGQIEIVNEKVQELQELLPKVTAQRINESETSCDPHAVTEDCETLPDTSGVEAVEEKSGTPLFKEIENTDKEKHLQRPLKISVDEPEKFKEKEKLYSPKVTIKPIKAPEEEVSTTSEAEVCKGSLKMTITKQSDKMHSILKVYNPDEEDQKESIEEPIPKLIIKPKMQQIEQQHSPKMSTRSSKQVYSPTSSSQRCSSPRVTIKPVVKPDSNRETVSPLKKPVVKPDSNRESVSPLKITIKPIVKSEETSKRHSPKVKPSSKDEEQRVHSPKVTIKPIVKPPEEVEPLHSPRITIKPIPKPTDAELDTTLPSTPKVIIKPIRRQEEIEKDIEQERSSPKITIKPLIRPGEMDQENSQPITPRVTIKPIKKHEESDLIDSDLSEKIPTKISIKPVIKPTENDNDEADEEVKERIVLKINKGSLPTPSKESKKREHPPDDERSEKLAKIKLKFSKEGGHPHIVQQCEESNKRSYEDQAIPEKGSKKQKVDTPIYESTRSKQKEVLHIQSVEENEDSTDDVRLIENKLNSPIVISEDSRSQHSGDCVIVEDSQDSINVPVVEPKPQLKVTPNKESGSGASSTSTTPTSTTPIVRKRGRPRKVPLVVREEFIEPTPEPEPEEPAKPEEPPAVHESGRPKRSCRGQNVMATLGIKPRKPRGGGRGGRGGKTNIGSRAVPMKPEK